MDPVDEELKQKLKSIGEKIDQNYENYKNNIIKIINELKIYIKNTKKLIEKNSINIIPKIQLMPEIKNPNEFINFFINVILFIFSNLEIINEFCLGDEYKEILKKLPYQNEKYFI